jgi:hypothetical protein
MLGEGKCEDVGTSLYHICVCTGCLGGPIVFVSRYPCTRIDLQVWALSLLARWRKARLSELALEIAGKVKKTAPLR